MGLKFKKIITGNGSVKENGYLLLTISYVFIKPIPYFSGISS